MEFRVSLERVEKPSDDDEALIRELESKARFSAIEKTGRVPTLTELLYHMSEEEMLDIKDLVGDATNE